MAPLASHCSLQQATTCRHHRSPDSSTPGLQRVKGSPHSLSSAVYSGLKYICCVFTSSYTKAWPGKMYIRPVPGHHSSLPRTPPWSAKLTQPYKLLLSCHLALMQFFSGDNYAFFRRIYNFLRQASPANYSCRNMMASSLRNSICLHRKVSFLLDFLYNWPSFPSSFRIAFCLLLDYNLSK